MFIPGICMGCPTHLGNVLCLPLKELKTLYHICLKIRFVPFEIEGVFVRDNELDLQNVQESLKIEHLPFRNKRNQTQHMKRKQKSLTEKPEEKEKRLFSRHATHAGFPTVDLSSKCVLRRGFVLSQANISRSGPLVQVAPH